MPMSTMIGSDTFFVCLQCGSAYPDRQIASECEEYCKVNRKMNPELKERAAKCPC